MDEPIDSRSLLSSTHMKESADVEKESRTREAFEPHYLTDAILNTRTTSNDSERLSLKDLPKSKKYQQNRSLICLEVISSRVMKVILWTTYLVFFVCLGIDFQTLYQGFSSADSLYPLNSYPCGAVTNNGTVVQTGSMGCMTNNNTWVAEVLDLDNIISVDIYGAFTNDTLHGSSLPRNFTQEVPYTASLWACYEPEGCGSHFSTDILDTDETKWKSVIDIGSVDTSPKGYELSYMSLTAQENPANDLAQEISFPLINITFQNQEAIPTNGIVKSYFIEVQYSHVLSDTVDSILQSNYTEYRFTALRRPDSHIASISGLILFALTTLITTAYMYILYREQKWDWLPEQLWLVIYFVGVMFFQNPIYLSLNFMTDPKAQDAFASYMMDHTSSVLFVIIWLLLADSVHYNDGNTKQVGKSAWRFYFTKILFGMTLYAISITLLTYQFPTLSPDTSQHGYSPVQATSTWPPVARRNYTRLSITNMCLFFGFFLWWIQKLYLSGKTLNKVPYMQTRYLQLSYRFFRRQAFLVLMYYLINYCMVVYYLTNYQRTGYSSVNNKDTLTSEFNTIARQQTQLFGKALFLTVCVLQLAFVFLPATVFENSKALSLAFSKFVLREKDLQALTKQRRLLIDDMAKKDILNVNGFVFTQKPEIFCVEIALYASDMAYESYYDPKEVETESGSGPIDLKQHGYTLIGCIYEHSVETVCIVGRHKRTNKLVISFRGTNSTNHWKSNLDYGKKVLDLDALSLGDVDAEDGLDIDTLDGDNIASEDVSDAMEMTKKGVGEKMSTNQLETAELTVTDDDDGNDDNNDNNGNNDDISDDGSFMSARDSQTSRSISISSDSSSDLSLKSMDNIPIDSSRSRMSFKEALVDRTLKGAKMVKDGIQTATTTVVDGAMNMANDLAKVTPVIQDFVRPSVHSGFLEAYLPVRNRLHTMVRAELKKSPCKVIVTGHSLGGALATLACYDIATHTIPRVNRHHRYLHKINNPDLQQGYENEGRDSLLGGEQNDLEVGSSDRSILSHNSSNNKCKGKNFASRRWKTHISLYNYGSPKVGNGAFVRDFNALVPNAFRVVVHGDMVPSLPPWGYTHVGTEVVIDGNGYGSLIVDPSFVEMTLRPMMMKKRNYIAVQKHFLSQYRAGLRGIVILSNQEAELCLPGDTTTGGDESPIRIKRMDSGEDMIHTIKKSQYPPGMVGSLDAYDNSDSGMISRPSFTEFRRNLTTTIFTQSGEVNLMEDTNDEGLHYTSEDGSKNQSTGNNRGTIVTTDVNENTESLWSFFGGEWATSLVFSIFETDEEINSEIAAVKSEVPQRLSPTRQKLHHPENGGEVTLNPVQQFPHV